MDKLYIVIPAYNEEENIKDCVNAWYPVVEMHNKGGESRLVIVNDGSKDNTLKVLEELSENMPNLVILTKKNGGHGSSVLYGYQYAIDNDADYVFQTDSDGQTNPEEFDGFWAEKDNYDAIIGNRVVRGDGKDRKFVENVVCLLLRIVFGVKVKDANAPFRLMKTQLVAKYIKKLPKDFNIPNIMFTAYFVYHNEKVKFIPITFKPREKGTNTINVKKIVKIGIKAVKDFYKLKREIDNV